MPGQNAWTMPGFLQIPSIYLIRFHLQIMHGPCMGLGAWTKSMGGAWNFADSQHLLCSLFRIDAWTMPGIRCVDKSMDFYRFPAFTSTIFIYK